MNAPHRKQKCTMGSKRETGKLGNASAAVTGLSTTKHPLNNSVINSLGRLRRSVPPLAQPLLSAYAPEVPRRLQEYERMELAVLTAFILSHFYSLSLFTFPFSCSTYAYSLCSPAIVRLQQTLGTRGEQILTNYV